MSEPKYGVRIARGLVTYWQDEPLSTLDLAEECQAAILRHTGEYGEIERVLLSVPLPKDAA